jgi:antitoxin VapB
MALYIRNKSVDQLAERLRKALRVHTKTDAVRTALKHELERIENAMPLRDRVREIQMSLGIGGRASGFDHKAFSDSLYDE